MLELFNTSFVWLLFRVVWWPTKQSKNMTSSFLGLATSLALQLSTILVLELLRQVKMGSVVSPVTRLAWEKAGACCLILPEVCLPFGYRLLGRGLRRTGQSLCERWVISSFCKKWNYFQVHFWAVVTEKQLCNNTLFMQCKNKIILKFDVYNSRLWYIYILYNFWW